MPQKPHYITIRGTKDGLVFLLDDTCSLDDLLIELKEKLSADQDRFSGGPLMAVKLKTGNRYLSEEQKEQIRHLILKEKNLIVEEFESNVVTKAEAQEMAKQKRVTSVTQIVRSGQLIEVAGDLLLIGDVNSGAEVKATGSIYVMGALRGTAHAGYEGNSQAVIAASVLTPIQLRIADDIISGSDILHTDNDVQCAFVDEETKEITVDRIQSLHRLKMSLATS